MGRLPWTPMLLALVSLMCSGIATGQEGRYVLVEDFESLSPPGLPVGWTAQDANLDLTSWQGRPLGGARGSASARILASSAGADDWLFSPGVTIQPGVPYTLTISCRVTDPDKPHDLEVAMANAPDASALMVVLGPSLLIGTREVTTETLPPFAFVTGGTRYLAFHGMAQPDSLGMFLDNIILSRDETALVVRLSLDREFYEGVATYASTDDIRCQISVVNNGAVPQCLNTLMGVGHESDPQAVVSLRVEGPSGPVPARAKYEPVLPGGEDFQELLPGESRFKNFELNRGHYDFTQPGTYTVRAVYKNLHLSPGCDAWRGKIVSAPVTLQIQ